jgi:ribosomal protein S18 acetylase RimI-like enzyme
MHTAPAIAIGALEPTDRAIGRALIGAVARRARKRGCSRVYWHTRENNLAARALYDSLASFEGIIQYEHPL